MNPSIWTPQEQFKLRVSDPRARDIIAYYPKCEEELIGNKSAQRNAVSGVTSKVSDGPLGMLSQSYDGSNYQATIVPDAFSPMFEGSRFSFSGWFLTRTVAPAAQAIWTNYGTGNNFVGLFLFTSNLTWRVRDAANVTVTVTIAGVIANKWYKFGVCMDGTVLRAVLDRTTGTASNGALVPPIVTGGAGLTFGGSASASSPFNGKIAEILCHRKARTNDDFLDEYYHPLRHRQPMGWGRSTTTYAPGSEIQMTWPVQDAGCQANTDDEATFTVEGTTIGVVTGIEYRVKPLGGAYTAWGDASATLGVNTFEYDLTLPRDTYEIQSRLTNFPDVVDTVTNYRIGDVFPNGGQSNDVGRFSAPSVITPNGRGTSGSAWNETDGFKALNDPTSADSGVNGSVWPKFGTRCVADRDYPVICPCLGIGGTPMSYWQVGATGYNRFISMVTNSRVGAIRAILFDQGQSDAINGVSRADYLQFLLDLADGFGADLPWYDEPIFIPNQIGQVAGAGGLSATDDNVDNIRLAQRDAARTHPWIYPGAAMWDAVQLDDKVHYKTSIDMAKFDPRVYWCLKAACFGGPSALGPQISAITQDGTVGLLDFDSPLAAAPSGFATGIFTVMDGVTSITVNSATKTGDSQLALALASEPSAAVLYSMGSGSRASITTNPVVPMEATGTIPAEFFKNRGLTVPSGGGFPIIGSGILRGRR